MKKAQVRNGQLDKFISLVPTVLRKLRAGNREGGGSLFAINPIYAVLEHTGPVVTLSRLDKYIWPPFCLESR